MKTPLKTICSLLASAMLTLALASCSSTKDVISYTDDNGKVTASMNENMFSYHLSDSKTFYLYGLGATGDSAELWNMKATEEGKTVGDMALESVKTSAKKMVASAHMFELLKDGDTEGGMAVVETEIEKKVDSVVEQLTRSLGSKGELESYLSQFGVDIKNLRAYYTLYYKSEAIKASFTATEDEKKAYFADNYSIVKHILINTTFKVKDDGSRVSQTEEERAAQLARAEALSARLSAGEDFDELWALPEYQDADAAGAAMYPEGYFVCENSKFTPEFEAAALDMKDGEIRTVNSTYGIHIMKKYPMDSEKYNLYSDVDAALSSAVASASYEKAVAPYAERVTVDEELLSAYSMASAPTMLQ